MLVTFGRFIIVQIKIVKLVLKQTISTGDITGFNFDARQTVSEQMHLSYLRAVSNVTLE